MRLVLLCVMLAARPAHGSTEAMTLIAGRGAVIDCPGGVARVSTSNPEVVDAVVASDSEVLFHAKATGQATLAVWSKAGERRTFEVTVEPNLEPLRAYRKSYANPIAAANLCGSFRNATVQGVLMSDAVYESAIEKLLGDAGAQIARP